MHSVYVISDITNIPTGHCFIGHHDFTPLLYIINSYRFNVTEEIPGITEGDV